MYKKIVVPLDGSTAAECVLRHVGSVAGKGSEIVLVRVVALPHYDYMLRDAQLSACLDDEFSMEASDYLKEKARSLKVTALPSPRACSPSRDRSPWSCRSSQRRQRPT